METLDASNTITDKLKKVDERRKEILLGGYRLVAQLIIDVLIIAVLLTLVGGTYRVFITIFGALSGEAIEEVFPKILNDVMLVFVFVELFRVLIEYFKEERVKITYIADATTVLILKEIWVRFTAKSITPIETFAMVAVLLAVGAIRFMAVWRSPGGMAYGETDDTPE
ncbi:MAG: phosphate-starvation-inducible PsiE family protein [Chloroflexi bacterium]|nr:phosphate-starvation-inducible PsiE family protein [Chloroflexota bacterium]